MTRHNHTVGGKTRPAKDTPPKISATYHIGCPVCLRLFWSLDPFNYQCPRCGWNSAIKGEQVVKEQA